MAPRARFELTTLHLPGEFSKKLCAVSGVAYREFKSHFSFSSCTQFCTQILHIFFCQNTNTLPAQGITTNLHHFLDGRIEREPVMRISTSLLALCCQSGLDATLDTPIRARSRSSGSRSLRISPLLMARSTSA